MVPREDGRLMVGATVEERGFDTTVTAGGVHELLREAYRVAPRGRRARVRRARRRAAAGEPRQRADRRPGARTARVLLATGHFRNGVLLAPVTGEAVAALLAGEPPPDGLRALLAGRFERAARRARRRREVGAR